MPSEQKKRVCYFYDANVGNYHYGPGHPMRPHRIRMCHGLVMNYGLYKKMEIYRAKPANKWEMTQFHTDEYIDFLSRVTPDNMDQFQKEQAKFNVGDDSPVFEGLFEYCGLSAGGSMEGAARLNRGLCDIAINWAGGLHHAKKMEASGFCYVNDIVLGILELLRYYARVLYIDIDVHHGDGVEEAFYTTDRVMTVSFHKYGEFFPGTGELMDVGVQKGKYYSVNVPLRDGIDDESYRSTFEPVIEKVMEWYRPAAVVLQCGGDSLSGDKLGCFNLSMKGHANCVKFVKKFNLPTLVLGGGGYTMRNVARAWAYETGVVVGQDIGPEMPYNDYYEYYGPDYKLDVRASNMDNLNTPDYLEKIKTQVFENLSRTLFAPSVQMQEVPRDADMSEDEDEQDPDDRMTENYWDRRIMPENEYYDSDEGEAQGSGNNVTSRHERDYNDTSDVQMSQEEEDQIAEALKEDEGNDNEKEAKTEQVQQQDTEMDTADETETNGHVQPIEAVEEDTVMEDAVQKEESTSDERITDKTENEEQTSQSQQTSERQVVEGSPVQQEEDLKPQPMEQDKSPHEPQSPKEAVSDIQSSENILEPTSATEEKADEAIKHTPSPTEATTAAVTTTESPFSTQIVKEDIMESTDNQISGEPVKTVVEEEDIKSEETIPVKSEAMETETNETQVNEPEVEEPKTTEPEVKEPEVEEPEVKEPEVKEPEVKEPEMKESVLELPEIQEPQVKEPEVNVPRVEEPVGQEPKEKESELKEPEAMETDYNEPEAVESKIEEPHLQEMNEPEVREPVINEPEVNEPEAKNTDSAEPEAMEIETKNVEAATTQDDNTSSIETKHDEKEVFSDRLKPSQVQAAASTNLSAEPIPQSPLSPAKAGVESEEEGEVKSVKSQSPPPSPPKDNIVESNTTNPALEEEEEEEEEEALEDGEIAE